MILTTQLSNEDKDISKIKIDLQKLETEYTALIKERDTIKTERDNRPNITLDE